MEKTINLKKILPTKEEIEATNEYKLLINKIKLMTKTEINK